MQTIIRKDGFDFGFDSSYCSQCEGNCCIGESGYIWCSPKELSQIAKYLNITKEEFLETFTEKVGYKRTLIENKVGDNYHCVFFNSDKKSCSIYPVRPLQCRTFPFWEYFKKNTKEVIKECPGIVL